MSVASRWILAAISLIALDQGTKILATIFCPPFEEMGFVSIGVLLHENATTWTAALLMAYLLSVRIPPLSKCLILGGGISNFAEDLINNGVVDFIGVRLPSCYIVFNLADVMIVSGLIALVCCTRAMKPSDFIPGAEFWVRKGGKYEET